MAHDRETQRIVERAGTRIIRTDFKEKGPRAATSRALDHGAEKQARGPAAAMAWSDGQPASALRLAAAVSYDASCRKGSCSA